MISTLTADDRTLDSNAKGARFLKGLMDTNELVALNGDRPTRPSSEGTVSIIDLTITDHVAAQECEGWDILGEDFDTGFDHFVIAWSCNGDRARPNRAWKIRGRALKEKVDEGKVEVGGAGKASNPLERARQDRTGARWRRKAIRPESVPPSPHPNRRE